MIIGRENEKKIINEALDSEKSELIAVYGRRRVGKTFLVKESLDNNFTFYFTGTYLASKQVQLNFFRDSLSKYFNVDIPKLKDWYEAFKILGECLLSVDQSKLVIFFDEMPWMDTAKSEMLKAFSYFWNTWDYHAKLLKIFVCGSSTTWMMNKFIGDKGGLYGRITRAIYLAPFTLNETEQFLIKCKNIVLNRVDILEIYMILGGIPYYLDMLDSSIPLSKNIDNLFFKNNAILKHEFDFLFRSLFNESTLYSSIVRVLSSRQNGFTRNELVEKGLFNNNGEFSLALKNLVACDFVSCTNQIDKKCKDNIYYVMDPFVLFYLRFVDKKTKLDENYWTNIMLSSEKSNWSGHAFELVCFNHIKNIKGKLGITGILSNVYSWSRKPFVDKDGTNYLGGQIDMLIDRKDNVIDVVEIKHSNSPYVITESYEKKLRERACAFAKSIKTKKALHHVLVSVYGLQKNIYSSFIQNVVTLDDLFSN